MARDPVLRLLRGRLGRHGARRAARRGSAARRAGAGARQPDDPGLHASLRSACCGRACRRRSSAWSSPGAVTRRNTATGTDHAHDHPHGSRPRSRPRPRRGPGPRAPHRWPRSPADRGLRAVAGGEGRARSSCSAGWPRPRRRSTRCRSSRSTCTRSARSTRSSTSSAPCSALEWFGVDRVVASPLNVGGGTVAVGARRVPGAGAGDGAAAGGRAGLRERRPDGDW